MKCYALSHRHLLARCVVRDAERVAPGEGNEVENDIYNLEPLEIAVLQIVHGLTITGRPQADNLLAMKRGFAEQEPEATPDAINRRLEANLWYKRQKMRVREPGTDKWVPAPERRRLFLIDKVPAILIQAELLRHGSVIRERLGLLLGDDISKRADGTIRALRLQALLEDDGKYTSFPTNAYIRPDGTHIYMDVREYANGNLWWTVRGFSEERVSDLDWLKRASPNTAGDRGYTAVCVTRGAMIGYVLTSRGLAAVKGLPEILDPSVEWAPAKQSAEPRKTGNAGRPGEQSDNAESPQSPIYLSTIPAPGPCEREAEDPADGQGGGQEGQRTETGGLAPQVGLVVDRDNRAVKWGGVELEINAKAHFAMFVALHSDAGRVVPYIELLKAVKPDSLIATVEKLTEAPPEVRTPISHIRAALRKVGCPWAIKATPGLGYKLVLSPAKKPE